MSCSTSFLVRRILFVSAVSLGGPSSLWAADVSVPSPLDFNRDIRPILSENCFKCHGFDPATRKADRRLDTREGALAELDGVRAIVPGKLKESDLSVRIHSTEKDEVMPPPKTGKKLTAEQVAMLDRWVKEGAPYAAHWSFQKPQAKSLPVLSDATLVGALNPIDLWIRSRLAATSLRPSPPADPFTLVRRVYLDLIGLPPTPEEADAYVQDTSPQAYEKLVDRLLDSPHYGERWARRWLDLARYSDTNGYEKDHERTIWPYRDWVIKAINAGMPFDQFTIEQIAGDMLAKPTRDQIVATGFHRNTMLNEEGGIDPLEFRYLSVVDRVMTTATTWLGLTVQCAQCHTHKYDPIPHREYFQFMASLNNADEPMLAVVSQDEMALDAGRKERLVKLLNELPEKFPVPPLPKEAPDSSGCPNDAGAVGDLAPQPTIAERRQSIVQSKFAEWLAQERKKIVRWIPLRPVEAKSNLPFLAVQADLSIFASGDFTKSDTYELKFSGVPEGITALRLEAIADPRLPGGGPGTTFYEGENGEFFLNELEWSADGGAVKIGRASESYSGNEIGGSKAVSAALATDGDRQTGWSTFGRSGESQEAVFVPAVPLGKVGLLDLKLFFGRYYSSSLGRFRISVTTDPRGAEARELPTEIGNLLGRPDISLTVAERRELLDWFLLNSPELASQRKEIEELRKPVKRLTTLVMKERPPENPRPTFLHHRGEWLQPKERVDGGFLSALGPVAADLPRNRLGLARWLVSRENPLTARVVMNREWAAIFGQGIVRTTGDFGLQGDAPTHPELLDWLAVEFMDHGWSVKHMHKLIVTSATYRQSSATRPADLTVDPQNTLLARGPRFRLEAELVRDSALKASGLLVEKIGGPSVRPSQPAGVTEVAWGSPKWTASGGGDRFRRSLYTFAKRTAPFALFNTFDAPTGEACIARRDVSNTPLQALTLLNDVVFIEAAQALGKVLSAHSGTVEDRVRLGFRRVLTRPPTAEETAMLVGFFEAQKGRFTNHPADAEALVGQGIGGLAERAAWMALSRALFNLDEAVTRS